MSGIALWRPAFVLAAVLLLVGAPQHPDGTMEEMLGHPAWIRAHSLMLAGFTAFLVGLMVLRAAPALPERTHRWTGYALVGTALQVVEMVLHTASVVDHGNLVAGQPTPVGGELLSCSAIR